MCVCDSRICRENSLLENIFTNTKNTFQFWFRVWSTVFRGAHEGIREESGFPPQHELLHQLSLRESSRARQSTENVAEHALNYSVCGVSVDANWIWQHWSVSLCRHIHKLSRQFTFRHLFSGLRCTSVGRASEVAQSPSGSQCGVPEPWSHPK